MLLRPLRQDPSLQDRIILQCAFSAAAEAQTHPHRVVKLRFFSSCFEYLDFFVGNRIVCVSESCFSRKVMSEVSVSRWRRNPSARSALPSAAAEAQTHPHRVVKLRFFSSCFEYLDFFVGNRIVCVSESCFSRKVMSEVSVSRWRRNPSARSALPLTRTLTRP